MIERYFTYKLGIFLLFRKTLLLNKIITLLPIVIVDKYACR